MAIKLLRIANQQSVIQVKLDDGKEVWGQVTPEVKSFALQNLKPGDDIDIISETKADGLHISKIGKVGTLAGTPPGPLGSQTPSSTPVSTNSHSTISNSYEKGQYRVPMSPEESRMVRRQSVMGYACNVCSAIICQTDSKPEAVADYVIVVFNKLLSEVEK